MTKVHDRGGWHSDEPIDRKEHHLLPWEKLAFALAQVLCEKEFLKPDQLRHSIENLGWAKYESLSYFERIAAAIEQVLVTKHILLNEEIENQVASLENPS